MDCLKETVLQANFVASLSLYLYILDETFYLEYEYNPYLRLLQSNNRERQTIDLNLQLHTNIDLLCFVWLI